MVDVFLRGILRQTLIEELREMGVRVSVSHGAAQASPGIPGGGKVVFTEEQFPGTFAAGDPKKEARVVALIATGPSATVVVTLGEAVGIVVRGMGVMIGRQREVVPRPAQLLMLCGRGSGGVGADAGLLAFKKILSPDGFWGGLVQDVRVFRSGKRPFDPVREYLSNVDPGRSAVWLWGGCEAISVSAVALVLKGFVGDGSDLREAMQSVKRRG